jgi:hypothetical protein
MTRETTQLNENFTDGTMHPHAPTVYNICIEKTEILGCTPNLPMSSMTILLLLFVNKYSHEVQQTC